MKKLVFDVGGSTIKYALMDDDANIYDKGKIPTPQDTLEHFLSDLKDITLKYENEIDGIAMSLPGTIDTEKGQIYSPGALTYNANVNLKEKVKEFTDLPFSMENDGKCAALAEKWKGNLKEYNDGVVLVFGTGIGGGIIKDGKLWKGKHLFAGEFSFAMDGEPDDFMKAAYAMKASTTALIMEVCARKNVAPMTYNGLQIFEMINNGDEDCLEALHVVCKNIAKLIFNLQAILDPEKFCIGGGISQQPILLEKIQEELDRIYAMIPFEIPRAVVDTCEYFNDSNKIGALYHFLEETK